MRPSGTLRTTKAARSAPGGELNEYERVRPVPGISTLTYCPGRKLRLPASSRSMAKPMVESDSRSTEAMVPLKVATPVLHAVDEAATLTTQSEVGRVWHARM